MFVIPDPAALEVGELDFAAGDVGEDVGEGTFGAVEGAHRVAALGLRGVRGFWVLVALAWAWCSALMRARSWRGGRSWSLGG